MPTLAPFAEIEAMVNHDCLAALANAVANINGGEDEAVIFDDAYATGEVGELGMESTAPAVSLQTASVPASPRGKAVVVQGKGSYTIAKHLPDGTGWSVLLLELAA
ncbi:hypothetical protein P3G55_18875 [Leptospira sp. 96542]|nr:hypothetical protein [Leptospira sp. 96542]